MALKLLLLLFTSLLMAVMAEEGYDPAAEQIILFKENAACPVGVLTTGTGAPVTCKGTTTLNKRLLHNEYYMESLTHAVRERIPERIVHTKGAGAFGHFEVTHDVTDVCKAAFLSEIGKRIRVAVRFSSIFQGRGGIDTAREPRGFAVKFYTEEGNFDLVGLNIPVFVFRDPVFFSDLVRSQGRNPVTNILYSNTQWDFFTLHPESLHVVLMAFNDTGIYDGFRYMPGFSVHTYQVVAKNGKNYFVRFHFESDQGIKTLSSQKAKKIAADDPDYATRDLYNAIAKRKFPSWTVSMQVLSWKDVQNAGFDVFDLTRTLPLDKYPLIKFGRLTLNKNPENYFADVEQLAYCPSNLVPGIVGAPDKIFESRRQMYREAQYYRLGTNFFNIAVNCPLKRSLTYNRDGSPPVKDNMKGIPNYYPNSFRGPAPCQEYDEVELVEIYEGQPDSVDQSRELYVSLSEGQRKRLIQNLVFELRMIAKFLQKRAIKLFASIHPDLGNRIQMGLHGNATN